MLRIATARFFKSRSIAPLIGSASFSTKHIIMDTVYKPTSKNSVTFEQSSHVEHREISDRKALNKLYLTIHPTQKNHLKHIQFTFGTIHFSVDTHVDKTKTRFIFSNDLEIPDYLPKILKCISEKQNPDPTYRLGEVLRTRKLQSKVGLIVGNGSVLSLLPELPASDILLLDIEPAVHYFVLQIKKLIIECEDDSDFSSVRKNLIEQINQLAKILRPNKDSELVTEMEKLGNLHFLASKERFKICRDALLKKDLIPIHVNIFSEESMNQLIKLLIKSNCEISFMNLTNVAEYDQQNVLYSLLSKMPFAQHFYCLATSHFTDCARTFISKNTSELETTLDNTAKNLNKFNVLQAALLMMANKGPA